MTLQQALNILHEFLKRTAYKKLVEFVSSYTDYYDFGYSPYDPKRKDGNTEKAWMTKAITHTLTQAKYTRTAAEKDDLSVIIAALTLIAHTNDQELETVNVKPADPNADAKHDKSKPLVANAKTEAAFALGLLQQFYTKNYQEATSYYLQAATAKQPIHIAERLLHSLPTKTDAKPKNLLVAYHYALYKPLRDNNFANYHIADLIKNYGANATVELLLNDRLLNDNQKQQILLNTALHPSDFCQPEDFYQALKNKNNSQGKLWLNILKTELFAHAKSQAAHLARNLRDNDNTEKTKKTALLQFAGGPKIFNAADEKVPALQPLLESPHPMRQPYGVMNTGWTTPILSAINESAPQQASSKLFAGGWWKWNRFFDSPTGNRTGDFFKGVICALDRLSEHALDAENITNNTLKSYLRPR